MYQHETKLHTFHKKMVKIVHRYRQYMIQIYTLLHKKIHVQHSVPQNDIIGPHTSIQITPCSNSLQLFRHVLAKITIQHG